MPDAVDNWERPDAAEPDPDRPLAAVAPVGASDNAQAATGQAALWDWERPDAGEPNPGRFTPGRSSGGGSSGSGEGSSAGSAYAPNSSVQWSVQLEPGQYVVLDGSAGAEEVALGGSAVAAPIDQEFAPGDAGSPAVTDTGAVSGTASGSYTLPIWVGDGVLTVDLTLPGRDAGGDAVTITVPRITVTVGATSAPPYPLTRTSQVLNLTAPLLIYQGATRAALCWTLSPGAALGVRSGQALAQYRLDTDLEVALPGGASLVMNADGTTTAAYRFATGWGDATLEAGDWLIRLRLGYSDGSVDDTEALLVRVLAA